MNLRGAPQRWHPALCLLAIGLVCAPRCSDAAFAKEPAKFYLRIASQPLDEALQEFARQSGIQIIYFSRLTQGIQAPGLYGQYTLTAAMTALLTGSNLTFRVINLKTVEIRPASAERSPGKPSEAHLTDATADSAIPGSKKNSQRPVGIEEVVINGTAEGLVATRTATPLRQIPQTVAIISPEQMRQQNDTDLAEALGHATGITAARVNSLDQVFSARGFQITSVRLDGGAALSAFDTTSVPFFGTPDLSEFDRIEVLRGADGLFSGNGNPGAAISLVRKRPLASPVLAFDASGGSWNNYRAEFDVTGPLGLDDALRGRLDGVYANRNYFYDTASLERKKVFAAFEYDITPDTLLTAGGSYQWDDATPYVNGLPRYADGSDARLPRNTALAFDWARFETRAREVYLKLEHAFDGGWKFRVNTTSLETAARYDYAYFRSVIDPVTKGLRSLPSSLFTTVPNVRNQFAVDAVLTGAFHWLGQREEIAVGGDFAHFRDTREVGLFPSFASLVSNVFDYDPASYPNPRAVSAPQSQTRIRETSRQGGLFASMKVHLGQALSVIGGARYSRDTAAVNSVLTFASSAQLDSARSRNSGKVTPYAALTYDLNATYSLYASYSDIYQFFGAVRRVDRTLIEPADGVDVEAGIKGAWRDGMLNGSLALYKIDQYGFPLADDLGDPTRAFPGCCYRPATNQSRGVDAEVSGKVAPTWLIGAGYTYNTNHAASGGELSAQTPRHLLKVWTSSELPGSFHRVTVGGTLQAQSRNVIAGGSCALIDIFGNCGVPVQYFTVVQNPYVVVDVRASVQIDAHWRAALSVDNVFDRSYYQTINLPQSNNWYGEPRNVLLRVDGRY